MLFKYFALEIVLLVGFVFSALSFNRFKHEYDAAQRFLSGKLQLRTNLFELWLTKRRRALGFMIFNVVLAAGLYVTLILTILNYVHHHS